MNSPSVAVGLLLSLAACSAQQAAQPGLADARQRRDGAAWAGAVFGQGLRDVPSQQSGGSCRGFGSSSPDLSSYTSEPEFLRRWPIRRRWATNKRIGDE